MRFTPLPTSASRLGVLQEVLHALSPDLDQRRLHEGAVAGARRLLGVPLAAALSWDPGRGELVVEAVSSDDAAATYVPAGDLALCAGPAYASRTTITIDDLEAHPRAPAVAHALRIGATAAAPLLSGSTAHGVLVVAQLKRSAPPDGLSPEDLRLFELLADHVGNMLAGADAVATAVRRAAKAEELAQAFRSIGECRDRDAIINCGLECSTAIFGADRAAFYQYTGRGDITFAASRRLSRLYLDEVLKRYRRSVGGLIPIARTPIYVADVTTDPRTRVMHDVAAHEGLRSMLLMPLIHRGQLFGAIALYHDLVWHYEPEDIAPVRALADEMALALANANLHQQTQRQLAHLRVLERVARVAAEAGSAAERADRVLRVLVERGAAVRAWTLGEGGAPWATAGDDGAGPAREAAGQAAQAALLAGRAVARSGGPGPMVAAPLGAEGAVVLELAPPRPAEARPPTMFHAIAEEPDVGLELELVAGVAGHLAAGIAAAQAAAAAGLAATLAGVPRGVLVLDTEGRVVFHNQEALAAHGLEGRDLTGWRAADLLPEGGQRALVGPDGTPLGEIIVGRK
jgi:GAF domain-containing protein